MTCPRSPRGARTESRVCRKPEKKEEPHSFHEARTHKMCVSQEQPAMHWPSCLQVITPHCLLKTRLLSYSRKLRELLLPNATCPFLPLHTHLPRWLGARSKLAPWSRTTQTRIFSRKNRLLASSLSKTKTTFPTAGRKLQWGVGRKTWHLTGWLLSGDTRKKAGQGRDLELLPPSSLCFSRLPESVACLVFVLMLFQPLNCSATLHFWVTHSSLRPSWPLPGYPSLTWRGMYPPCRQELRVYESRHILQPSPARVPL